MEEEDFEKKEMTTIGGFQIHFTCLGLGCLAWITILLAGFTIFTILLKTS